MEYSISKTRAVTVLAVSILLSAASAYARDTKYHDAAIQGLRGPVKECVFKSADGDVTVNSFDRQGRELDEAGEVKYEYVYDVHGYPVTREQENFFGTEVTRYTYIPWGDEYLLSSYNLQNSSFDYVYEGPDCVAVSTRVSSLLGDFKTNTAYRITARDSHGNWTERELIDLDEEPHKSLGVQHREITYYGDIPVPAKYRQPSFEITPREMVEGVLGIVPYGEYTISEFVDAMKSQPGWQCDFYSVRDGHLDIHVREIKSKYDLCKHDIYISGYEKPVPYLLISFGEDAGVYGFHALDKKDAQKLFNAILTDLTASGLDFKTLDNPYYTTLMRATRGDYTYNLGLTSRPKSQSEISLLICGPTFQK